MAYLQLKQNIKSFRNSIWKAVDNTLYKFKKDSDVLYAFYDLAVAPPTFDIILFLILADRERRRKNCKSLHVVIVPGPNKGFRLKDDFSKVNLSSMRWRVSNLLVPCCWQIPSCRQITVCVSRKEAMIIQASVARYMFPKGYSVRFPVRGDKFEPFVTSKNKLPSVKANKQALVYVNRQIQSKIGKRKLISITLRECTYEIERNSNLHDWIAFAEGLDRDTYCPVFIRDIEKSHEPLYNKTGELLLSFPEVVWNIELRTAFYEICYLNMFVNDGPHFLSRFNRNARSLIFKIITPSVGVTTEKYFLARGLKKGMQLETTSPFHRIVWEDDKLSIIESEFVNMCNRIEEANLSKSL